MVYRRHEIYQIACEHDLIILEDDAYYFLQVYNFFIYNRNRVDWRLALKKS